MFRGSNHKLSAAMLAATLFAGGGLLSEASAHTYVYSGQSFGINGENTIAGATHVTVTFASSVLLSASTLYDVSTAPFASMSLSDGVDTIAVGGGSFLGSSFIKTDAAGDITTWFIAELQGAGRTFVGGNQCCTINDPPFIYTINNDGTTDASFQTNGFFGIGPREGFAFNNRAPGCWSVDGGAANCPASAPTPPTSVPEPASWALMLTGFLATGVALRRRRPTHIAG